MSRSRISGEASSKADFSQIRYAQCWEDADVLLEALDPQPGDHCLSIASAGDNALALLARGPAKVTALDLNPAQLCCARLRCAAYRNLEHSELLQLIGSAPCEERDALYRRCRASLDDETRAFWDARPGLVARGIGDAGKFERYFRLFRSRALPLVHGRRRVASLLVHRSPDERARFFAQSWDTWRWRLLFRIFFSRFVMGKLGRDPRFFDYVEGSVADRILHRTRHALEILDPSANPYLQWILLGRHATALPFALRPENFDTIRENVHRVEWRLGSIEDFCREQPASSAHRFNLSDIFEYMSDENFHALLAQLAAIAAPGARLAYWNMLAPRSRPESMADRLRPLEALSRRLHSEDKAFFYSRFIVEEVIR